MSKIKILFLSLALGLAVTTVTFAQTPAAPQSAVAIAQVNIGNAKIVEQSGNNFNISFVLSNGEGLQTNVKYAVRLLKKDGSTQKTIDEKVYEESLTLAENSQVSKSILYSAPETLSGAYSLVVVSFNNKGFPFGAASLGEVTLASSKKGLEILSDSCSITSRANLTPQLISKHLEFFPRDAITLSCTVVNNTSANLSASAVFELKEGSAYGAVVENTVLKYNPHVDFKALEKKTVSVALPEVAVPGVYSLSLKFEASGSYSNVVTMPYRVAGKAASIVNISPDADYYDRGDTANITLLWSGVDALHVETAITTGKWNRLCGKVSTESLSQGTHVFSVPIKRSCMDPNIKITITDGNGATLDEQSVAIETISRSNTSGIFSGPRGTILIIVILVILAGLGIYMKRKGMHKSTTALSIAIVGLAMSLIPLSDASANTYVAGPNSDIFVTVNVSHLPSSPNQTPDVYTPGETIVVDGMIISGAAAPYTVTLSAITIGNVSVDLFGGSMTLLAAPNGQLFGTQKYLTAPGCGQPSCSYGVDFTAGVTAQQNNPPVIGTAFMIGPHFHGTTYARKIVYVGQKQHPELTVRVKDYGQATDPYMHTSEEVPPSNLDQIFIIPESTGSGQTTQYASCASNCGIPLNGFNYAVTSSVTGANVATYIPYPYHVCRYPDAPGPGMYFSPAYWGASFVDDTCQNRYPDAEVVY